MRHGGRKSRVEEQDRGTRGGEEKKKEGEREKDRAREREVQMEREKGGQGTDQRD